MENLHNTPNQRETMQSNQREYLLLGRLVEDAKQYIQNPKTKIWGVTREAHVAEMYKLHDAIKIKPSWLHRWEIASLAIKMSRTANNN